MSEKVGSGTDNLLITNVRPTRVEQSELILSSRCMSFSLRYPVVIVILHQQQSVTIISSLTATALTNRVLVSTFWLAACMSLLVSGRVVVVELFNS